MRHIIANVMLFVGYCIVAMLSDWLYVRQGQQHDSLLFALGMPLLMWSSVPVAWFVNWRLLRIEKPRTRVLVGAALGLLAFAVAFYPFCLLMLYFHMWIGGTF